MGSAPIDLKTFRNIPRSNEKGQSHGPAF